jgi:hypothetical protein
MYHQTSIQGFNPRPTMKGLPFIMACLSISDTSPMFDLPSVIMDNTPIKGAPILHTTIFNPIGKY